MRKILCTVQYHFEHVPRFMRKFVQKEFMKNRNEVVDIFNDHIDEVNKLWDLTGKPAAFSDHVKDINPEYVDHIKNYIQPAIDAVNKKFPICKYRIDDIGNIVGYIPIIRKSKIFFTIKEIES